MTANRKKLLLPTEMARAGWAVLDGRDDIEAVAYSPETNEAELHAELATASGIALWGRPFRAVDVTAAPNLQAVARIGVGYDAVDVPALSAAGIPLLTAGIANSISVAEQALFFMFHLAKVGAEMDAVVKQGRWEDRYSRKLFDLAGRKLLIVGFGRIGTRLAARCLALEMQVFVHDPYIAQDAIAARLAAWAAASTLGTRRSSASLRAKVIAQPCCASSSAATASTLRASVTPR